MEPASELDLFLQQSVVVLGAAVAVLLVSHRLRVPPIVSLLLTGLVLGPSGAGLVSDGDVIHMLAEIGVVLLLFVIGLELPLSRLKELRRPFLIGGSVQALLTTLIGTALASLAGLRPDRAVFFGMVLTLSSTAIVLKLYTDRRETESPHGKVALAILIFQDFLIVPMIVLTPVLGGEVAASAGELLRRFGGAFAALTLVFLVGHYLMPFVFRQFVFTRIREVLVLGALGICLAMAWMTHSLGFSLALGAFVAGILVSETDYSHQVVADMVPFRDVFASVFFVSIGMLVDLRFVAENLPAVIGLALGVVVIKALTCGAAVALLRFPARTVIRVAFALAQIGEFSFVLMEVGHSHGLLQGERYQLILSAAVLTMLATPGLLKLGTVLPNLQRDAQPSDEVAPGKKSGHVIVVGFGTGGSLLARVLRETGISYVIVELNGDTVRRARKKGEPIFYGDVTRREILHQAGLEKANIIVFMLSDTVATRHAVHLVRDLHPSIQILVRVRRVVDIEPLRQDGADQVIAEEFETAIELFTRVLERFRVPRNIVRTQTRLMRGEGYRMLRAPALAEGVSEAMLDALAAGTTDVFRIEPNHAVAGRTLSDLDVRHKTGASIIAVVRDEATHSNPSADLILESGDNLVMVGSHAEVEAAFDLLQEMTAPTATPSDRESRSNSVKLDPIEDRPPD